MKKIIYSAMAVAMLATTSCKDDFAETFVGDQATVEFSISTPEIGTRAYSDGTTATHLQYAVYEANDAETLTQVTGELTNFDGNETISLTLKTGKDYKVVFWAAAPNAPYAINFEAKTMTVNYLDENGNVNVNCNDENLDAFYAVATVNTSATHPHSVELKRPFAQLNIGTNDYTEAAAANYEPKYSKVVVKQLKNQLNLLTGAVEGTAADITFGYSVIPNKQDDYVEANKENFPVTGYEYLAMNYLLVPVDQEVVDVTFYHNTDGTSDIAENTKTVGSVPVRRNYRTNIYGGLLTGTADINVEIVPGFGGDENKEIVEVATATQLQDAIEKGGNGETIILTGDINLNDLFGPNPAPTRSASDAKTLEIKKGTNRIIDLNGYTLSATTAKTGNCDMMLIKGDLTVKNGTITYKYTGENQGWNAMTTIFDVTGGGVLNLEGVTAKNLGGSDMGFVAHLNNWGEVTLNVENSTLESNYVAVRVFNSGYDMNNVTIKNSKLKGGNYAFWVHNYTVADFGTQEKADAQKALLNFDIFNGTNTFVGKDNTPIRYGFTDAIYLEASGLRYENKTYYIPSANALVALSSKKIEEGEKVVLTADIDLTGVEFNGLSAFNSENNNTFDGQGYTVSNWTNNSGASDMGFIKNWVGPIKNINFVNCHLKTAGRSAIVAAKVYGNIENVHVTDCSIEDSYWACGLIAGLYNNGSVENCSATNSSVKSNGGTAAIVGVVNESAGTRSFTNCKVEGCTINNTGVYGEAYSGAAIAGMINVSNSTITFDGCQQINNTFKGNHIFDAFHAPTSDDNTIVIK